MATETTDRRAAHLRGVKVTSIAAIVGVIAGVLSAALATGPTDRIGLAVFVGAVFVEMGILQLLGVDIDDFSTKDHLYVAFMTFSLWFISWTIILTSGASL
ncbi:MAG: hypothetical protein ABEH65_08825 [Halobacteriales archaeon]